MSRFAFSASTLRAFLILFTFWIITCLGLIALERMQYLTLTKAPGENPLLLLLTLPFIGFYLVVLIAATAGYARSVAIANRLFEVLRQELGNRRLSEPSIRSLVRSAATIEENESYVKALDIVIHSRVPIVAVVGENKKVEFVITATDLLSKLADKIEEARNSTTGEKGAITDLVKLKVKDLTLSTPESVSEDDNLEDVSEKMIRHQFTKLVVVKTGSTGEFAGTIDALGVLGEIFQAAKQAKE